METGQKLTLPDMMRLLDSVDQGLVDIPLESLQIVGEELESKVDSLKRFIIACEERELSIKAQVEELEAARKVLANKRTSLTEYIANTMVANNFEKLSGKQWVMSRRESQAVDFSREMDWKAVAESGCKYVRVKTTYEPDKAAMKEVLKSGYVPVLGAYLRKNYSIAWSVKK